MRNQLTTIDALLKKREIKKAEIIIARHLRTTTNEQQQAKLFIYRARTRLLNARPEAALDDLLKARTLSAELLETPDNIELLADCHFARFELSSVGFADRNHAEQALQLYHQIMRDFPQYHNLGWVYYQLGRVFLSESNVIKAVDHFQQSLLMPSHLPPLTAYCYERLAFVAFYEQRDFQRALAFLSKSVDTYPASEDQMWLIQVYILRSRVYRETQQPQLALQAAQTALNLASSGRSDRRMGLAEALLTNGELLSHIPGRERDLIGYLEQFLQISKRPLGVDVTWSRVYEMLADAYCVVGRFDDAINAYNLVMQFNPYHPWEISIYYRIARAYYQQGAYEKTIEALRHALEVARNDGHEHDYRMYDLLGSAHFALARYQLASEAYATALTLAPQKDEHLDKIRKYHQFSLEKLNQTL